MAEPTTQPPPETSGQDFVYRPVSGVAIAAVIFGGLYAVLLLVFAVIALWRGEPFLLPLWWLLLPAAGVVLALLGRWHILRSEDTRAGMGLTRWALWISLVTGLGYATFYFVTELAVTTQANNFLMEKGPDSGFLARLKDGEVNAAFLLTRTLSGRSGANPNDQEAMNELFDQPQQGSPGGSLTLFGRDPVVRSLVAAGKSATIEPLGVRSWSYENKGYKVERLYNIDTPEGSFEVLITTQSTSVQGENSKWYVYWQPKLKWSSPIKRTTEGQKLLQLRRQSAFFANAWFSKVIRRDVLQAYLDTQPPSQRGPLERKAKALDQTVFPSWLPQALQNRLKAESLPGFYDFLQGQGCLHSDQLWAPDQQLQHLLRQQLAQFVSDPIQGQLLIPLRQGGEWELSKIEEKPPGRVTVTHNFDLPMQVRVGTRQPQQAIILGEIVLEAAGGEPNNPDQQRWQVVRVNFLRAFGGPPPKGAPGGGN